MKEITLKFFTPEEKAPEMKRVRDKNHNVRDVMILAQTTDGIIHAACYTDQVDAKFDFKVWHTKKPIRGVVSWAELPVLGNAEVMVL